ncbi:MAG: hypothetical protein C4308_02725 [Chitinophagaceae bacterium]
MREGEFFEELLLDLPFEVLRLPPEEDLSLFDELTVALLLLILVRNPWDEVREVFSALLDADLFFARNCF